MKHPLETLMKEEITKISNSTAYSVNYSIECTIHSPKGDYKALFITDFSLLRDYVNKFSDVLSVTPVLGLGTIQHCIMPYPKELECTMRLTPLAQTTNYVEARHLQIQEYRYKAVLYENDFEMIKGNRLSSSVRATADVEDIAPVQLQLVNPLQEQLRTKTFGGIIRDTNPMLAIQALLTKFSRIDGIDSQYMVKGVDIQEGYTKEIRTHIGVPHLTPVIRLPKVIDELVGGLYPTGMQYYLQQNMWFIWSPFDTSRYEKAQISMTVFNIPSNKMPQIEKSFRLTPTQLIILCTGEVGYQPFSDKTLVNESHGVRFVDGSKILDGIGKTGDNKLVVDARKNVNEFLDNKATNNKNIPINESETRITTHYFKEYTKVAMRKGAFLQFTWENSADNLIYPGMPVRYVYMQNNEPRQTYGTVIAVESTYRSMNPGIIQRRYANKTMVSLFVDDTLMNAKML